MTLEYRTRENVSAKELTTFGVGSGVKKLIEPESVNGLLEAVKHLEGETPLILGNGSNVVLPDAWIAKPVIRLPKSLSGIVPSENEVRKNLRALEGILYFAGTSLMNISRTLSQEGKSGLEFGAGIPASLGGAVRMNAGAHGCSISTVVEGAVVCELDGTLKYLSNADLNYSYRHSSILPSQIVVAVSLKLQDGDPETIKGQRQKCLDYRTKTQPLKFPSSGSVFRNPDSPNPESPVAGPLMAAAYYLEQVGLKGHRLGGVGYSEQHSNWLVGLDDSGRAEEVQKLIELGQNRVFEKFGLELKPEILLW